MFISVISGYGKRVRTFFSLFFPRKFFPKAIIPFLWSGKNHKKKKKPDFHQVFLDNFAFIPLDSTGSLSCHFISSFHLKGCHIVLKNKSNQLLTSSITIIHLQVLKIFLLQGLIEETANFSQAVNCFTQLIKIPFITVIIAPV